MAAKEVPKLIRSEKKPGRARRSAVVTRLRGLLKTAYAHEKEPALRPLLMARHLLRVYDDWCDSLLDERAIVVSALNGLHDFFLSQVEEFGWVRVPAPGAIALSSVLADYIQTATALGKTVVFKRDVPRVAQLFAEFAVEFWPVVHYLVLDLMCTNALADDRLHPSLAYELAIAWTGKGKSASPTLTLVPEVAESVFERLWLEAAILLVAQTPSSTLDKNLSAGARAKTNGVVSRGAALLSGRYALIATRRPEALPFKAMAYVRTSIKNAAREDERSGTVERVKRATRSRYRKLGLAEDASEYEISVMETAMHLQKAHHVDDALTKRELQRALQKRLHHKISLRQIDRAAFEVQRQTGTAPPRDGRYLRFDRQWVKKIEELVRARQASFPNET